MSKVLDSSLHGTRGNKFRSLPVIGSNSWGIKFVQKAGSWCVYHNFNTPKKTNSLFWFSDQEQAQAKLQELLK